ncbi:hypothetical protein GCM10028791_12130 [Echinicola sediminis]
MVVKAIDQEKYVLRAREMVSFHVCLPWGFYFFKVNHMEIIVGIVQWPEEPFRGKLPSFNQKALNVRQRRKLNCLKKAF